MRIARLLSVLALFASGIVSAGCWSSGDRNGPHTGTGGSGPTRPPLGTVTTCSGTEAPLPAIPDLPAIAALPDPFQSLDGTPITTAAQWGTCRRAEIAAQAQLYELGDKPARPESVSGSFAAGRLTVSVTNAGSTITFDATITPPTNGASPPYPAMIGVGGIMLGSAQLNAMGVATIIFPNDAIAEQNNVRGRGAFYTLYGSDHNAGAMIAWSWGVSRLIDALEQTADAQIDAGRLGVTGCSRNGKGALIAGAFDERIKLTIPQESGSGGAASWRISDAQIAAGTTVQTLSEIVGENVWFRKSFSSFAGVTTQLPFDHHMIEGLVAPRALLVIENTDQIWLGNISTYNGSMAAHEIWNALGIPDNMGVSQVGHPDHCGFPASQQPELNAYVQKFLVGGGTASTSVLRTTGGYGYDKATWVPWSVPVL
jgi:hypothetical protein